MNYKLIILIHHKLYQTQCLCKAKGYEEHFSLTSVIFQVSVESESLFDLLHIVFEI